MYFSVFLHFSVELHTESRNNISFPIIHGGKPNHNKMYDISIKLISFILPNVQFIMSCIFDELARIIQMEMLQTAPKCSKMLQNAFQIQMN